MGTVAMKSTTAKPVFKGDHEDQENVVLKLRWSGPSCGTRRKVHVQINARQHQ